MQETEWHGLYSESWGSDLVPEAYSHPAKYSRGLIRQIYAYMLEAGMIASGDVIGDPFGGQAGGALDAMLNGLHWRGVELEPRFVALGNQNIELWNGRYAPHMRRWGTAVLLQGDSRGFAGIVGELAGCVSSPPYVDAVNQRGNGIDTDRMKNAHDRRERNDNSNLGKDMLYGRSPGQLGSMPPGDLDCVISSPPFGEGETRNRSSFQGGEIASMMSRAYTQDKQGDTPGNLAHLKAADADLDAVISSPPYGDAINAVTSGIDWEKAGRPDRVKPSANRHNTMTDGVTSYGRSPGQVGVLDAVISSSPFENQHPSHDTATNYDGFRHIGTVKNGAVDSYGSTPGNTGNTTGDTFWAASKTIVEQVYLALKPGGYVAWVTGNFKRKGKVVDFGGQWLSLCESIGFEPVCHATAWKTEYHGVQRGIFEDVEKRTDRVSFFRRLSNQKDPENAILNEDVYFVKKPLM